MLLKRLGMANSADTDQTAPRTSLFCIYTVCFAISSRKLNETLSSLEHFKTYTGLPLYNAVLGVHKTRPRYK